MMMIAPLNDPYALGQGLIFGSLVHVGHHLSSRPWAAADPGLAVRMENMEKENRELRQELVRAMKQKEKSTQTIEVLQQTWNEIFKRIGGHPAETPSSGASSSHGAADERDTT
ncbi:hypothetical protein MRX96_045784 [Rhipicephalus microplus]